MTTPPLDLEAIERDVACCLAGAQHVYDLLARVHALEADNAALREQVAACAAVGDPGPPPTPPDLEAENAALREQVAALVKMDDWRNDELRRVWEALGGPALPADPGPIHSPPVSGDPFDDSLELARQRMQELSTLRGALRTMYASVMRHSGYWIPDLEMDVGMAIDGIAEAADLLKE